MCNYRIVNKTFSLQCGVLYRWISRLHVLRKCIVQFVRKSSNSIVNCSSENSLKKIKWTLFTYAFSFGSDKCKFKRKNLYWCEIVSFSVFFFIFCFNIFFSIAKKWNRSFDTILCWFFGKSKVKNWSLVYPIFKMQTKQCVQYFFSFNDFFIQTAFFSEL